jgi:hypothetical protein
MTTAIIRFEKVPSDDPAAFRLEDAKKFALDANAHSQVHVGYQKQDNYVEFQVVPQVGTGNEVQRINNTIQQLAGFAGGTLPSVVEYR